jgi:signal transduction histidine kinase
MNGLEQEWISNQQHRTASYGRLPAGEYRFEVVARNRDGTWPAGGASTLLQIAPRYWETNWFRGLGAALAGVLVVLFWVQRLARRRALNALREQITRDLHDDLGSNLGSIALLSEALRRSSGRSNHEELLQEINRIARETLDSMRDMLWFVDPGRDDLADLVERLRQLTESLLKGVAHEFHAPAKLGAIPITLPLKRAAVLIFKEALHNVIRHAHASRVDVSIKVEGSFFSFEIVDHGLGFDVEMARDGHGLNNMKHRAQSIGGTLRLQTKPGEGTRLVFEVKLVDAG